MQLDELVTQQRGQEAGVGVLVRVRSRARVGAGVGVRAGGGVEARAGVGARVRVRCWAAFCSLELVPRVASSMLVEMKMLSRSAGLHPFELGSEMLRS